MRVRVEEKARDRVGLGFELELGLESRMNFELG